jgi:VWFA-related protein
MTGVRMSAGRRGFLQALSLLPITVAHTRRSAGQTVELFGRLPMFHADSTRVLIPFTAEDKRHHLVHGLTSEDIRLVSNGHEKHINFLHEEQGPASLLFVLDVSGSIGKPLAYVQDAMKRVLRAAAADDEFGVIEFSDRARLTIDFTSMNHAWRSGSVT